MPKSINSTHNRIFLALLRRCRQHKCVRQIDLARSLGRGQALISKVEAGERRLDIIELRTWLRALDVSFLGFMQELDERLLKEADFPAKGSSSL
jgi:transcriptional regulator with XRE-family HTH domain